MRVAIRLFAGIAERTGITEWVTEIHHDATVADVRAALIAEWPTLSDDFRVSFIARNERYARLDERISSDDRLAVIPPVSGGSPLSDIEEQFVITDCPISVDSTIRKVIHPRSGAVVTFVGTVREFTGDKQTVSLSYDAYREMALRMMEEIGREIENQWPEARLAMTHRIGDVAIEELCVIIAVSTPHRPEAFEAGRYAIERLKRIVPIWKKETYADGSEWLGHPDHGWDPTNPTVEKPALGGTLDEGK